MGKLTKPFQIEEEKVFEAWKQVRANRGTHGIDKQTIEMYENDLENNLYKLWNKMSSGVYFPREVRKVQIPKGNKGFRILGIPTVNDRIAQTVVANILNTVVDSKFHEDSYGFRPKKSTHQALEIVKNRCYKSAYVINLDIKGLFDNIPHELIYKALEPHNLEKWVTLYIKRLLEISDENNTGLGTPQGGVVSPILANIFMDICFDQWMAKNYPRIPFARYADDVVVHCKSEWQVFFILAEIEKRLQQCKIELNIEKTRLANTKAIKSERIKHVSFDFLGYTFKPQKGYNKEKHIAFKSFGPIISSKSKSKISKRINDLKVFKHTQMSLEEIAKIMNPRIRGWFNYYGYFNKIGNSKVDYHLNNKIIKFINKKHKLRSYMKALKIFKKIKKDNPNLFYNWQIFQY